MVNPDRCFQGRGGCGHHEFLPLLLSQKVFKVAILDFVREEKLSERDSLLVHQRTGTKIQGVAKPGDNFPQDGARDTPSLGLLNAAQGS